MSANDEFDRVEQLLRSAPAPAPVPPGLVDVAREAALGGAGAERRPIVSVARRRVPRLRMGRLTAGVAVMAAAAAAALLIGVGGPDTFSPERTIALAGPTGASATVDFGSSENGTRPMLVKIHDLRPAGPGWYYEMWFRVSGDDVSAVTFNTSSSGDATVRSAISADMHWGTCYVTLEKVGDTEQRRVVLRTT
ncbi:MAG TPA: anti-sigma factor [Gaiellales bacterium]|nr:anti-sigma factor [Gaiellales bacterium]